MWQGWWGMAYHCMGLQDPSPHVFAAPRVLATLAHTLRNCMSPPLLLPPPSVPRDEAGSQWVSAVSLWCLNPEVVFKSLSGTVNCWTCTQLPSSTWLPSQGTWGPAHPAQALDPSFNLHCRAGALHGPDQRDAGAPGRLCLRGQSWRGASSLMLCV